MTPETYMRRYHSGCGCGEDAAAVSAEELFSACPLAEPETNGCRNDSDDELPTCCCKRSMAEALRLLCDPTLAALVDFDSFFFLTDNLAVGSPLAAPGEGPDNIEELDATFRRFSPCNCDLIDVDATAYFATPGTDTVALEDVEQLSLCSLKAVAFGYTVPNCPSDCTGEGYRRIVRIIRRAIRAEDGDTSSCAACKAHCDCDSCCCDAGLLSELSSRNLSRLATLTVGNLVLQNVTVLGTVGSVLVLADEDAERIYFVCVSQVEALG